MLSRLAGIGDRLRHSALAIPAALLVAALMVALNEAAYRGAHSRLTRLAEMGQAHVQLMQAQQRTTEAEAGLRGYLITGGREYLQPYQEARQDVLARLEELRQAYGRFGDGEASQRHARLDKLVQDKLSELSEVMRQFDSGRQEAALDMVRSGIGREVMVQLRAEAQGLIAHQNARIAATLSDVIDTLLVNRIGITVMTLLALLALVMVVRVGHQLDRQRRDRQAEMAAERDRLELEVARRTAELTELARHLQTAREDERARLARELHDELGALLTAAKLDVARIRPKLQAAAPELMPRLAHLVESLNGGIALKRRIIEDLRPSTLSSLGLCPALDILCSEFAERSGLQVQAELEPVDLGASAELTVFRLVQEALTNIAKYAQARQVQVRLRPLDGEAEICVTDDGVGFDPAAQVRGSHGLVGMRFRVEAERGQFRLRSARGQGTTVTARLPLAVQVAAA